MSKEIKLNEMLPGLPYVVTSGSSGGLRIEAHGWLPGDGFG